MGPEQLLKSLFPVTGIRDVHICHWLISSFFDSFCCAHRMLKCSRMWCKITANSMWRMCLWGVKQCAHSVGWYQCNCCFCRKKIHVSFNACKNAVCNFVLFQRATYSFQCQSWQRSIVVCWNDLTLTAIFFTGTLGSHRLYFLKLLSKFSTTQNCFFCDCYIKVLLTLLRLKRHLENASIESSFSDVFMQSCCRHDQQRRKHNYPPLNCKGRHSAQQENYWKKVPAFMGG